MIRPVFYTHAAMIDQFGVLKDHPEYLKSRVAALSDNKAFYNNFGKVFSVAENVLDILEGDLRPGYHQKSLESRKPKKLVTLQKSEHESEDFARDRWSPAEKIEPLDLTKFYAKFSKNLTDFIDIHRYLADKAAENRPETTDLVPKFVKMAEFEAKMEVDESLREKVEKLTRDKNVMVIASKREMGIFLNQGQRVHSRLENFMKVTSV